jgi:hypothetical protein
LTFECIYFSALLVLHLLIPDVYLELFELLSLPGKRVSLVLVHLLLECDHVFLQDVKFLLRVIALLGKQIDLGVGFSQ